MKKNRLFEMLLCAVLAMMNLTGFTFAEESVRSFIHIASSRSLGG